MDYQCFQIIDFSDTLQKDGKTYHKRPSWLIDFSPEEEPTWPRSRGRLGMRHPDRKRQRIQKEAETWTFVANTGASLPQQGPGISSQV